MTRPEPPWWEDLAILATGTIGILIILAALAWASTW
jgi:hypothetical protein